jgi:hypothetical protein
VARRAALSTLARSKRPSGAQVGVASTTLLPWMKMATVSMVVVRVMINDCVSGRISKVLVSRSLCWH